MQSPLPILDTLQKKYFFLLGNVDIPIDTKRLVRISWYPCKIDLVRVPMTMESCGPFKNNIAMTPDGRISRSSLHCP